MFCLLVAFSWILVIDNDLIWRVSFLLLFFFCSTDLLFICVFPLLRVTKTFALLASVIVALTIIPTFAYILFTTKIKTGYGHLYVTVTEYEGQPFEVFATIGKSGRSTTAKTEAIGRLVSLALRSGVTVDKIVDQLKGIGGENPIFQNGGLVLSIPDAIARVLEKRYLTGENAIKHHKTQYSLLGEKCPECGQTVSFEEGCMICHFCGFNKCG